jgi:glycosyltransferase involved in cell wall biosynthesis
MKIAFVGQRSISSVGRGEKHKLKVFVLGMRGFPDVQGGVEKHCENLYPRLASLGCDVTVIIRTPYIPEEKQVPEWKGVKFIYLWCLRQKSLEAIIHTFLGVIVARLRSPDLLHIHAIGPSILVPLAKMLGLKVAMTNHGPDYKRQKWGKFAKIVLRLGEFFGLKFADKVIVISKTIKEFLEKKHGRKDLEFIPNGVNLPEIVFAGDILKKYDLEPQKYIFTACRFVPEKGLHDLIAAYERIENPGFNLVIAGDADHESEYSRNIKKSAKKSQGIILTGFISGKPLQELYSNAGLFVLSSYYEGLPIALLEAMSYDLPVLLSDLPQNKEIPLPEFRFFKPGDIDTLTKKMVELFKIGIGEEEKIKQKEILKENYNWDKIAEHTFKIYKSVVNSG